jgi:hypothetical protein
MLSAIDELIGQPASGEAPPHPLYFLLCAPDFWSGAEPDSSADGAGKDTPDYVSAAQRDRGRHQLLTR